MKRILVTAVFWTFVFASFSHAQKIAVPCPSPLNDIEDCPETGCGPSLDPHLNRRKNISSDNQDAGVMTIQQIRNLPESVSATELSLQLHDSCPPFSDYQSVCYYNDLLAFTQSFYFFARLTDLKASYRTVKNDA